MSIDSTLLALEDSALGATIGASEWLFPGIETLHVIALSTVFGTILIMDLRLLGWASRSTAVSKLSGELLPYTWIGFALAVVTGTLMFVSRAQTYYYNEQFRLKFVLLLLAGINMALFHRGAYRRVAHWNLGAPPSAARIAGAASITLWLGVIFLGRWVGFTI